MEMQTKNEEYIFIDKESKPAWIKNELDQLINIVICRDDSLLNKNFQGGHSENRFIQS